MTHWYLVTFSFCLCCAGNAGAALPDLLPYQGRLTRVDGTSYPPGMYATKFALTDSTGNIVLWTCDGSPGLPPASADSIALSENGLFALGLGVHHPIPDSIWSREQVWLRVWFNSGSGDEEILPYQRVYPAGATQYAEQARTTELLAGQPASYFRDWSHLQNVPSGFADGEDNTANSTLYDAVIAAAGGDYTSISAALAAGHKTLYLRRGTYLLAANVMLPDSGCLIGESWGNTVIEGTGSIITGNTVRLENFRFLHTGSSNAVHTGDSCTVSTLWIDNNGYGNGLYAGAGCQVSDCHIISIGCALSAASKLLADGNSLECRSTSSFLRFGAGSRFVNNVVTGCLSLLTATDLQIIGNTITGQGGSSTGISFIGSPIGRVVIADNLINGTFQSAIVLTYGISGIVSGNVITVSGQEGIAVFGASEPTGSCRATVTNNVINGGFLYRGIRIGGCYVTCTGNQVSGGSGVGITLENLASFNIVANNAVSGCAGDGFSLFTTHSAINGNLSYNNSGAGFRWSGSDFCATGNHATSNAGGNWVGAPTIEAGNVHP